MSSFDGSGTPDGSMTPNRLAVDEVTGDVYVIDSAHDAVDKFSSTGTYLGQLRGSSTTAGRFALGGADDDIAVDNSSGATQGNVYIVGENNGAISGSEISAFDASGTFLWQVLPHNTRGGSFDDTCGVAVDSSGNLWSADYYASAGLQQRSVVDGSVLQYGPAPGDSCHVAIDKDGALYLNHWQSSVEKFDAPSPWGGSSTIIDFNRNSDVATNSVTGDVYVAQDVPSPGSGQQVVAYDSAGSALFGGPFAAGTPLGVTVDGTRDRVYVSDPTSSNVHIWALPHTLTVRVDGAGSGRVDADSGTISGCTRSGGNCSGVYDDGTTVTLTATPDANTSVAWSGCTPAGDRCTTTLSASGTVTATFSRIQHTLSVAKAGTGSGSVSSSPAGIDCGATCSALFDQGTSVTLTATAAADSTFVGWSGGGCTGTGTCSAAISADTAVTATFQKNITPPPPPKRGTLVLAGHTATIRGSTASVKVSCTGDAGGTCRGSVTFKATVKTKVKKGRRRVVKKKTITVGSASYDLAVGSSGSLSVKLTSAAKKALKTANLIASADPPLRGTVKFPKTKARRHKKKH